MNSMRDAVSEAIEHPIATEPRTQPNAEHREGKVSWGNGLPRF